MARERQAEVPLGRRYIIKRPRLTRLLDASTARIIMLVAPAGYGKTTLAREWLENRPHAWYRGGPATADVAALSVGLGDAASAFLPRAPVRVRERLRATASPEQDVKPLAEILAEDLAEWPEDAWLAIDDYQFAMEAAAAEAFVDLLVELAPIRLLLTSRARPTWATSRRLLYGEIHELGRNLLAMNQEEATEVLAAKESEAPGLVALAEGWPAVIGLAALTRGNALPPEDVPARLYDFFAEELYAAAPPALREGLAALAIAPSIDQRVAAFLFGAESDELLEEGVRLGVLSQSDDGGVEIHPLLREFLESKLQEQDPAAVRALALKLSRYLIEERRWDDAFAVAERLADSELLAAVVETALHPMLLEGRLPTVGHWLAAAAQLKIEAPILDLAAAEVALRESRTAKATALALHTVDRLPSDHSLVSRAYFVVGEAAHREQRDDEARKHFQRAREAAKTADDAWAALWGEFLAASSLEHEEATQLLDELYEVPGDRASMALRRASARYVYGSRMGTLQGVLRQFESVVHLLPKESDPLIRCSFLLTFSGNLSLAARYEDALAIAEQHLQEADTFRIIFALAPAYAAKAYALIGLRRFGEARAVLARAAEAASELDDIHLMVNARALEVRLLLSQGAHADALHAATPLRGRLPEPAMVGEYLATRALALACAGDHSAAVAEAAEAEATTRGVEAAVLSASARAVIAIASALDDAPSAAAAVFEKALSAGNFDSVVCAYRAFPPLLHHFAECAQYRSEVLDLVTRAYDAGLAAKFRITVPRERRTDQPHLSRREKEVLALVARGMSNRNIAQALFITESTAKVHVRNILEKLGLHSRTEAAVWASRYLET